MPSSDAENFLVYRHDVDEVVSIDYEPIRERFPWVGLVNTGKQDLSARYREIQAEARRVRLRWVVQEDWS